MAIHGTMQNSKGRESEIVAFSFPIIEEEEV